MRGANGKRIGAAMVAVICCLAVLAEDIVFMANRLRWEALPTATLMQMGCDYYNIKNMPDSALLCLTMVANRYDKHLDDEDRKLCIRALCWIGFLYHTEFYDHSKTYDFYLKSMELAEKHHYDEFLPHIYHNLADLFWQQEMLQFGSHNHQKSFDGYKRAFWKAVEVKSYNELPAIFCDLGYSAFYTRQYWSIDKEMETYSRLPIPDTAALASCAESIRQAISRMKRGESGQAMHTLRHTSIAARTPHQRVALQIMLNELISQAHLELNQADSALMSLMRNKELTLQVAPSPLDFYVGLARFYEKTDNHAGAEKYELLAYHMADSLRQAIHAEELGKINFLRELDKMSEEQKELATKQRQDRILLWVVSGFLVLALGLVALLVASRHRIKRTNKILYENNLALLAADEQRRRQAEEAEQARAEAEAAKYGAIRMDEDTTTELWQNIVHVMEYSQEIYDENFSVARLAELIGAKPNYVSQAINQQQEWTFPTLLAHYRIREACRRINDRDAYGNCTIQAIGQSVGFKSRSHFITLFKKQTGLTPSDYLKMARQSAN